MTSTAVDVVRQMVLKFHEKLDTEEQLSQYASLFAPDVHWYDHAFLVCRVGTTAVMGLRKGFVYANQPFECSLKSIEETQTGSITAETVWKGRLANDIVRPDGQVAVKATGKDFVCHVCMLFKVNAQGQITRIDEYYNKSWDNGIPEEKYLIMKGLSIKE